MLTVAQAAKELDMVPDAVRAAIRAGRLPATKLGARATLIRRADIEKYKATPKQAGGRPRKQQPTADQ